MKKKQRRWLGWGVGAAILALILFHVSHDPQWRNFQWKRLGLLLIHLQLGSLILAIALSYATYLVRAYRWKFFVEPIKQCSLGVLFVAQILGFSSIYLIGRAGEAVRPAYIARAESLPFTSQLAVWVVERIYDAFSLVILFALALYFEPIHGLTPRSASIFHKFHEGAMVILTLCGVVVICLAVYHVYSEKLLTWLDHRLKSAPPRLRTNLMGFLRSFSLGLEVIRDPWDFFASVFCSALLWTGNVTIIWLVFRSLGGHLAELSWWAACLTMVFAGLGLAVQLPGVGGGYQVATLLALKDIFRVSAEGAASAAILTWLTVMAPCLALGLILLVYEGLSFKKLRRMAENEIEIVAPKV